MKPKYSRFLVTSLFTAALATSGVATANLYWSAAVAGNWDTTDLNWSATSGDTPTLAWTADESAVFDQAGAYTVTVNGDQTAVSLLVSAGDVTLAGGNVSSADVTISSGAKLTGPMETYLKAGVTALTVNGTLDNTLKVGSDTGRVASLTGNGVVTLNGTIRLTGGTDFSGDINGPNGINTENAGGAAMAFSGTNTFSGDTLFRYNKNVRLGSASALSPNSFWRLGSGILELAAADFSSFVTGGGAGNVRIGVAGDSGGNAGFAAINADRTVELKNAAPGSIVWGSTSFFPTPSTSSFYLGTNASTHKVTLNTGIDLGEATRSFVVDDGAAAVESEISGVLSGTTELSGIKKIGAGVLVLSGDNTFTGPVEMNSSGGVNTGWLRVAHSNALGPDATPKTIDLKLSTSGAKGGIQLIGGVTVNNKGIDIGGRSDNGTDSAVLQNLSGNNSWSGTIRIQGTGGSYYLFSQAGTLTLGGNLFNNVGNTSARPFNMLGAGNFLLTGSLKDNAVGGTKVSSLTQKGTGTTTLSGASHTYSGMTRIEDGTVALAAGATLANSSPIDVVGGTFDVSAGGGWTLGASQTLSGTSNVVGAMSSDGTISPASADVGDLNFDSSLTLNSGSTYALSIAADGLSSDKLLVSGILAVDGDINVSLNGYVPVEGDSFDIADAASITGAPTVSGDALTAGLAWDTSEFTTDGSIKVVVSSATPYDSWALGPFENPFSATGPTEDPDHDGLNNLLEFVLGGDPTISQAGISPSVVSASGGSLVVTFKRSDASEQAPAVLTKVQLSSDLAFSTPGSDIAIGPVSDAGPIAPSGASYTVVNSGGVDTVTVTIPGGGIKNFARVSAEQP